MAFPSPRFSAQGLWVGRGRPREAADPQEAFAPWLPRREAL